MTVKRRTFTAAGLGGAAALAGAGRASATDAALQQQASPDITDGYLKLSDDLTIHYQSAGHGQTAVIFVPGWTMTTAVFRHQLVHLSDSQKFKAITYDPRGQGSSTKTVEGHFYEQHARDLRAIIENLGIKQYVLVGWSAAGGDVLEYVRLYGREHLRGLILLDTCPKVRGYDYTTEWVWVGTKDNGDQDDATKSYSYTTMVDRAAVTQAFAEWALDDPSSENIDFVAGMTMQTSDSVAALLNSSYWFLDNTQQVVDLDGRVPLLYFTRAEWHGLAREWAKANTPTAAVESYGKHMMFWEHPKIFNEALDRFLRKA